MIERRRRRFPSRSHPNGESPTVLGIACSESKLPDGSVFTRPYGTGTGIEVWAETDVNADGQPVVRFPFNIPGL